jgi:hypothetical protein
VRRADPDFLSFFEGNDQNCRPLTVHSDAVKSGPTRSAFSL